MVVQDALDARPSTCAEFNFRANTKAPQIPKIVVYDVVNGNDTCQDDLNHSEIWATNHKPDPFKDALHHGQF